jgi:hypothetical protein
MGLKSLGTARNAKPDVCKALDPPEICMNRASRPYCRAMGAHPVSAGLDFRDTTIHQRQPPNSMVHAPIVDRRAPANGLKFSSLESASRRQFVA